MRVYSTYVNIGLKEEIILQVAVYNYKKINELNIHSNLIRGIPIIPDRDNCVGHWRIKQNKE